MLHVVFFVTVPEGHVGRHVVLGTEIDIIEERLNAVIAAIQVGNIGSDIGSEPDGVIQFTTIHLGG